MTEIQKIKQRKMSELLSPKKVGAGKIYSDMLVPAENIPGTYMFADIDYSDRTKASWKPAAHLGRLISELVNGGSEKIKNDGQWREKMLGALKFWLANDFFCDNWWYNQIGTPNSVLNIALILDDYLSDGMKAKIENIAVRGSFKARLILGIENFDFPSNSTPDVWGAANFTWAATTSINHALWTEDDTLLRICVDLIGKELCYSGKWRVNGILPDGSYVQHGVRWYSGGYGRAFVCEMAPIINLLGGTSFAVPEEKIDILLHHILEEGAVVAIEYEIDFEGKSREEVNLITEYLKYLEYLNKWNGELPSVMTGDSANIVIPVDPTK